MVRAKICGITNIEDALFCVRCGVDALGLIFYHKSPRSITMASAKKIIKEIGPFVSIVGVFVDAPKEEVHAIAKELRLTALQFHGGESPAYCNEFAKSYRVIKAIFPDQENLAAECKRYSVDAYLFDMSQEQKAKGIKKIPKDVLEKIAPIAQEKKVIVSGGLTPENIDSVLSIKNVYGVDAASGVESVPGKKDEQLLKAFLTKVKIYETT